MARPRKWRKVCCLPDNDRFGPLGAINNREDFIIMSIDEYETIRLIDLESFTQEECAGHMGIARTTVQGIYNDARQKLADSLVNGKVLRIQGGDYKLCGGHEHMCGCGGCRGNKCGNDSIELQTEEEKINE